MPTYRVNTPVTVYPTPEACRAAKSGTYWLIGYIHGEFSINGTTIPVAGKTILSHNEHPVSDIVSHTNCDCMTVSPDCMRLSHPPHNH